MYNVGSNAQNYRIADLGKLIKKELPNVELIINEDSIDGRSYKANFDRIKKDFGFKVEYDVKDAVKEIYQAFKDKTITSLDEDAYFRVKYLKKYTNNGEKRTGFFAKSYGRLQNLRSINLFNF